MKRAFSYAVLAVSIFLVAVTQTGQTRVSNTTFVADR